MPGMYAEPIPALGCVKVVIDVRDSSTEPQAEQARLYRSTRPPDDSEFWLYAERVRSRPTYVIEDVAPGPWGEPFEMTSFADVWYDTEAPVDTDLWYVCELVGADWTYLYAAPVAEVYSATFEAGVQGWVADAGSTLAWETADPLFGAGSIRTTVVGAPAFTGARTALSYPATAGQFYELTGWLRSPDGGFARLAVDWLDAGFSWLSVSYAQQTDVDAGALSRRWLAVKAPTNAAWVQPRVVYSSAADGDVLITDNVRIVHMGAAPTDPTGKLPVQLPSTVDGVPGGWLSDPVTPANDVRLRLLPGDDCDPDDLTRGVIFASHASQSRAAAGTRFDVVQQRLPYVASGRRKGPSSVLTLASLTFDDRDQVVTVIDPGTQLLLRLPAEFGISHRYIDVGDVGEAALSDDLTRPYRVLDLPYVEAPPPAGPIGGIDGARFGDLDRFPTWADFDAAKLTSIDLLYGSGSTIGLGAQ